LIANTNNNPKQ